MDNEHQITRQVRAAREDSQKSDDLIRAYIPFIRAEAAKFLSRPCTDQDDEFSIAMIAFHEAILGYEDRGAFLKYAATVIRSRLIDYHRKEARHQGHLSLYAKRGEDDRPMLETLSDGRDHFAESAHQEATRQEIEELSAVMAQFGVTFSDVADNAPKQERTLAACMKAVRYGAENKALQEELLRTKKLPLTQLTASGAERKTLERHRKYVLAMLLIQTNGYEIIRGHLCRVLKKKGGMPV